MEVPCPICKKPFPVQLIEEHANVCLGKDPTKKRKYAERKLETIMSGPFENQRKELERHGAVYRVSINMLRIINSIYIGFGTTIFVLGSLNCMEKYEHSSLYLILGGIWMFLGSLLLGPLKLPNLICKGKRRKMISVIYIVYLLLTLLSVSTLFLMNEIDITETKISLGTFIGFLAMLLVGLFISILSHYELNFMKRKNFYAQVRLEMGLMRLSNSSKKPIDTVMELTGCSRPVARLSLRSNEDALESVKQATLSVLEAESSEQDDMVCMICQSKPKEMLYLPCRHLCCCKECSNVGNLRVQCPLCRSRAQRVIHIFI